MNKPISISEDAAAARPACDSSDNYYQGMIGNGRSAALIEPDGTMSFACLPDFDSGTVFASLLDAETGGSMGISMEGGRAVRQYYEEKTTILVTEFASAEAAFRVIDFMPRYTWDGRAGTVGDAASDIVRVLEPLRGTPELVVHYDPRIDYGRFKTVSQCSKNGEAIASHTSGVDDDGHAIYESIYLYSDLDHQAVLDQKPLPLSGTKFLLLSYHDKVQRPNRDSVQLMLQRSRAYWLLWTARTHLPEKYREEVIRSALTLKMLQFDSTGAMLAAPTTSLPESIGEERNWDYRFCWIRDASMTVATLRKLGHPRMASRFIDWMLRTVPTKDDNLQIMYGLRGERELTEHTLDHFDGYMGSRPVRIGNAAFHQQQHDIYGILLDVVHQDIEGRSGTPERLDQLWTRVRSVVRTVSERWQEPDRGIWEIRGEMRHFVFSKMLCWVAVDRAIKIARMLGKDAWAELHEGLAQDIKTDILTKGWCSKVGAFVQAYDYDDLDASNLLMAEYGFLDGRDPRFIATTERSLERLCRKGLMYRYRNADDFGAPSSAFTVCSFWMVKALAQIGREKEARAMFEDLLKSANVHGLYGEDLHFETRRQLGNFPQAYSHLALINCALALDCEDEDEEMHIETMA